MRKIQKLLVGVFVGGVLLSGVGTGIAFVEYSTLNYGGRKVIGEEHLVTKTLTYNLNEELKNVILLKDYDYYAGRVTEVIEDPEVEKGVVQYDITYNEKRIRPFLWTDDGSVNNSERNRSDTLRIGLGTEYFGDGFGEFMEIKDMVLNDLKNHAISSYEQLNVTDVSIRIHPETMNLVQLHH